MLASVITEDPVLLPFLILIGFLLFQLTLSLSYPIVVLIHELGHAIPALILGKKKIIIHLGNAPYSKEIKILNISVRISRFSIRRGYTEYSNPPQNFLEAWLIVAMAPLLNIVIFIAGIYSIFNWQFSILGWLILLPVWLANTRITLSALWLKPVNLGTIDNPNWVQSDLVYLLNYRKP